MEHSLKDQVALITGGTAGIGKEIARAFLQAGAKVVLFGSNAQRGEEAVKELDSPRVQFMAVDVSKTKEVEEAVTKVLADVGQVDILVNNAGITRDQLLLKMTEEDWDQVLSVNLKSCYNLCKALVRAMMKARKGRIINIGSVVGLMGNVGQLNYAASKAGMVGFTRSLAKELATRNILVNCIAPGFIETAMTDELTEEQKKGILSQIPLGRMGQAKEIAEMALFLAGPHASYITGQVLAVDGGMTNN